MDIFEKHQHRIRVISILGPQNSGKSTLLNFMFGCDFTVSDGRCTRGIYGSLIKSNSENFDYYLILDTEGLQSIEKGDKEYDRKLILFCFAVSNVLIINTKDQITEDVRATLEICVDSLTKIDIVRVQKPSLYFVMNQKADPNKTTDRDAINKIISNFTSNGLITQLKIEETSFATLPSAFNCSIMKFNDGKSSVRNFATSNDFIDCVLKLTNNIISQIIQINSDEAFSNIYKWIEFSNNIFTTINKYTDLTLFKDIAEKKQENKLQEYLNEKIRSQLSNIVKRSIFDQISAINNYNDAEKHLKVELNNIKQILLNDFENYLKINSVSEMIRKIKKEHLISQLTQTEDSWIQLLKINKRKTDLIITIKSGKGIINERINFLLKSGKTFTKEQATQEFDLLFEARSDEIKKNIDESIKKTDLYFNFIYSIYSSLAKLALPNKIQLENDLNVDNIFYVDNNNNNLNVDFQSPLAKIKSRNTDYKDTELVINFKTMINEFKVIRNFDIFYEACKVNIYRAIELIQIYNKEKYFKELQKVLKQKFFLEWRPKEYSNSSEVCLNDFTMTDMPNGEIDVKQLKLSKNDLNLKQILKNKFYSYLNLKKELYTEEEFSLIVKNFICNKAINKDRSYLVFDNVEYKQKLESICYEIDPKIEVDHELVQSLILKIDNLFEDYNKDLSLFRLTLALEPKSFAHMMVFKTLFDLHSRKNIAEAEKELNIWKQEKSSMCTFFVSQLSPDSNKDKNNAEQFLRFYSENIEKLLIEKCNSFIGDKLEQIEPTFTRLKMQENRDLSLSSLRKEQLFSFITEPTNYLLNDFKIIWESFENGINQEISLFKVKISKNFTELNNCLYQIKEFLNQHKQSTETFRASEMFKLTNDSVDEKSCEINNTSYLKGLYATTLLFDLILMKSIDYLSTIKIENDKFELDSEIKFTLSQLKLNTSDEFKDTLNPILEDLKKISIDFIDLFIMNMLELIDDTIKSFMSKEFTLESLGFKKDKYISRIKGCETSCPCCHRLCDAEHYKVNTEIGSETNKHKCNRGHQFRGFNGFKLEKTNTPSFKICELMKNKDSIRYEGKLINWTEYKNLHPKWDFDSTDNAKEWENQCTYIWSLIGEDICKKFGMTFTRVPNNIIESIHFILVLDDSGSMSEDNKWNNLIKSVANFLEIRSGIAEDRISIIYFSVDASIVVSNSNIHPDLVNNLGTPSYGGGTNYSNALQQVINIIKENECKSQKFGIIFMSDGEASYPKKEIKLIKSNHINSIYKFWTIGYGKTENFDVLKTMLRELYGNENNFNNPTDFIELLNIYIEIARE